MIKQFKNKNLERFFQTGQMQGLPQEQTRRLALILALLDQMRELRDLPPSLKPHPLKGEYQDYWSVKVNRNYRLIFKFEDGQVTHLDYLDYH